MESGDERGAGRGRKLCKGKTRQAKQEQLRSRCPSRSHPRRPADAAKAGPDNVIDFLAVITSLSGACDGAQAGTNTISSGGNEIRRAPLGRRSSALGARQHRTRALPAEAGGREAGSGPRRGVLGLAEASSGTAACPPEKGTLPRAALAAWPRRSPTQGLRRSPGPRSAGRGRRLRARWKRPRRPGERCPFPGVTLPQNPPRGSPRAAQRAGEPTRETQPTTDGRTQRGDEGQGL